MKILKQTFGSEITILSWKVKEGEFLAANRIIFVYSTQENGQISQKKYKVSESGTVKRLLVDENVPITYGLPIIELEECPHATVIKDMCAHCGTDLRNVNDSSTASVPMIHTVPELKVSLDIAKKIGASDTEFLLRNRKLVLLVDLDQTLIHTTNNDVNPNLKSVKHFQLYGPKSPWYHTKLRPGTQQFLEKVSKHYELHICTFGARDYAHRIAEFLDPCSKLFHDRILSRDECFDPSSKTANLKSLFPCGDNLVCIIDDREDVWSYAKNLIHVKPYLFFVNTGDINAPFTATAALAAQTNEQKSRMEQTVEAAPAAAASSTQQLPIIDESDAASSLEINEKPEEKDSDHESIPEVFQNVNSDETQNGSGENRDKQLEKEEKEKESEVEKMEIEAPLVATIPSDVEVEQEDTDDYLLYLEEILQKIYNEFYKRYDRIVSEKQGFMPDLKQIIPEVRGQVLCGCKLVFSGLVAKDKRLEQSQPYRVAVGLGASVTDVIDASCTHLVAVKPGTEKVRLASQWSKLIVVTPTWLWMCAERWEHVDERMFPLRTEIARFSPPPHCSPDAGDRTAAAEANSNLVAVGSLKRKREIDFFDSYNPLMSFSKADIADMDREVDDYYNEENTSSPSDNEDDDDDDDKIDRANRDAEASLAAAAADEHPNDDSERNRRILRRLSPDYSSSSSDESMTADCPPGWKKRKRNDDKKKDSEEDDDDEEDGDDDDDNEDSDDSSDDDDIEADDDLKRMGQELEREFLSD